MTDSVILLTLLTLVLALAALARAGPRSDVAQRLNRALVGTPMAHLGYELEAAGWHWRVHPALMAAIAGKESSLGAAPCPNDRFDVWGLGACGSAWSPPAFASWRGAFGYFAHFLKRTWPRAHTPWELYGYCSGCMGTWAPVVAGYMNSWGFPAVVGYGRG